MNGKIGILEVSSRSHYIYIASIARILLKKDLQLIIFTYEDIAHNIRKVIGEHNNINYNLISKEQHPKILIKAAFCCDSLNYLLITTIERKNLVYMLKKPVATFFITIHNLNDWFSKDIITMHSIKKSLLYLLQRKLLRKAIGINVGSENMKEYVLGIYHYKKTINIFPFALYEGGGDAVISNKEINVLRFTIPGSVDNGRRDYNLLNNALKMLNERKLNKNIRLEFVLLGEPIDKSIINLLIKNKSDSINVVSYDDFVSHDEYIKVLSETDYILGNIKLEINQEIYGLSKDTGANYAMLQKGIPGIFPCGFNNFKELRKVTYYYRSEEELVDIIAENANHLDKVISNKKEAVEAAICYCKRIESENYFS